MSQAVIFREFGKAEEVSALEVSPHPELQDGQILVRMLATPINPADINFIQGNYGIRPELPDTPGIEGTGRILESKAEGYPEGAHVIFLERVGTWKSHVVCEASKALVIDAKIDFLQASMLKVNPITAWRILTGYTKLKEGDWVIQNAANSGVGQCFIQIAKLLGLKTINVVRREGLEKDLLELGADHVLLDDNELVDKVREICGDKLPKLASNAVGGDSALRLMDALADQGVHVTYGAMSMRSLKVPNKFLIFKRIRLEGLWITKWIAEEKRKKIEETYAQLGEWVAAGKLTQKIDQTFRPDQLKEALVRAQESRRDGKVVIDWSDY
ncbi:NADPH:quinone reductase [Rubritalea squalenifaciens DSM 18772]|uniref:enoyl-[acyl-carrier-protein] reductase n=1 Tax=Rubritalea squalenifaciens DSM 18772 TaxID=1123071 RepID=A0A1M6BJB2_9BACT|nr:2-enoyl thioester reductase domain-containing protein [Rubritalea squalenifaciens]SHI48737.1 NADPH:quinone reductase [Rubritalea squalenifaciens DSM 18772]